MQATYNPSTNTYTYTEDPSNLHHSPILGWAYDGYPIYGFYGYTAANNPASGVSRMRTGFVRRNGQNSTQDLRTTGRITLPKWAATVFGVANPTNVNPVPLATAQYGPATTCQTTGPGGLTTYSLGRYAGDYDFLGDLGQTQGVGFDLDQYNGRTCVTPEFPSGTYAYFVAIDASGQTAFPHMLSKKYYGTPNAFHGAPLLLDSLRYEDAARETLSVTRLSYLLSGFALQREDGSWQKCPNRPHGSMRKSGAPSSTSASCRRRPAARCAFTSARMRPPRRVRSPLPRTVRRPTRATAIPSPPRSSRICPVPFASPRSFPPRPPSASPRRSNSSTCRKSSRPIASR